MPKAFIVIEDFRVTRILLVRPHGQHVSVAVIAPISRSNQLGADMRVDIVVYDSRVVLVEVRHEPRWRNKRQLLLLVDRPWDRGWKRLVDLDHLVVPADHLEGVDRVVHVPELDSPDLVDNAIHHDAVAGNILGDRLSKRIGRTRGES